MAECPNYAIENYDLIKSLIDANLNTYVAEVRAEQSYGAQFKDVKTVGGVKDQKVSFPACAIRTGNTQFATPMTRSLTGSQEVEVIIAAQHPNPVTLEKHMRGYEVALVRALTKVSDEQGGWQVQISRANKTPQFLVGTTDEALTQRVGVVVSVTRTERRR